MILICYGTRPEFIKIQPLITELKGNVSYKLLFTGQHTDIANFQYDYKLNVRPLQNRLDSIFSSCLDLDESIFFGIECVMVMGDTASAAAMDKINIVNTCPKISPEKIEKEIKLIFTANKINSIDIRITITFFLFKNIPTIPKEKMIAPRVR